MSSAFPSTANTPGDKEVQRFISICISELKVMKLLLILTYYPVAELIPAILLGKDLLYIN